jgi:2-oxoglutarate dehydrogenase E2 component (dihydrolipoamide succinyltransferase)
MSTLEVEITDLYVAEGDTVSSGQVLMAIAADKVDLEVEASSSGVIERIDATVGDMREVGDVVAVIRATVA